MESYREYLDRIDSEADMKASDTEKTIKVHFYEQADDDLLKFAVIIARSNGKWVICKHRERETYEVPGGHRDEGETIYEAACRELQEETGANSFEIKPVCVYSVIGKTRIDETLNTETFGMLYTAEIFTFGELNSEIEKILIMDELPDVWTYPLIQPKLIEEAKRRGCL